MTVKSRKAIRQQLATDLATALVGTGLPAGVVYNHLRPTYELSPCVCVASAGVDQSKEAPRNRAGTNVATYNFDLVVFVDRDTDANYGAELAQDALDDVAQGIFEYLELNSYKESYWLDLQRNGTSSASPGTLGGRAVWAEIHPITLQVWP